MKIMGIILCSLVTFLSTQSFANAKPAFPYHIGTTLGANYVFEPIQSAGGYNPHELTTVTPDGTDLLSQAASGNFGKKCISDINLSYPNELIVNRELIRDDSFDGAEWCITKITVREENKQHKVLFSQQFGSLASSAFDHVVLIPIIGALVQKDKACGQMNLALQELWRSANAYGLWCK